MYTTKSGKVVSLTREQVEVALDTGIVLAPRRGQAWALGQRVDVLLGLREKAALAVRHAGVQRTSGVV